MLSAMPERALDAEIDRLYQLPLDEFTAARNALAKESGKDGAEIRRLEKPPLAAWAINQVYWQSRATYHAYAAAASALKTAHAAVLAGKRADLRAAGEAHEAALESTLKTALSILKHAGHPASDATKQAIASTLRAMPGTTDPPGRLTRTLQPGGFELLAGMPIAAGGSARPKDVPRKDTPPAHEVRGKGAAAAKAPNKALTKAREALAAAKSAEKAAEQANRREEFEAARHSREAERASTRLASAKEAFDAAREALDAAETEVAETTRARDAALRRVRETATALAAAHVRAEAAQAEVTRHEKS
jgi:hypothetical protein